MSSKPNKQEEESETKKNPEGRQQGQTNRPGQREEKDPSKKQGGGQQGQKR